MGMCTEVSVSSGGYVHVCAKEQGHQKGWHRCACGQSFDNRDVSNTARRKDKQVHIH